MFAISRRQTKTKYKNKQKGDVSSQSIESFIIEVVMSCID